MQYGVKDVEVRIAFPETLHVLGQANLCHCRVLCPDPGVVHGSDLHHVLVKALALVRSGDNRIADRMLERMLEVVPDLPVLPLLLGIVALHGSGEALVVGFRDRLADKRDVVRRTAAVHILGDELPVVVRQAPLALTEG